MLVLVKLTSGKTLYPELSHLVRKFSTFDQMHQSGLFIQNVYASPELILGFLSGYSILQGSKETHHVSTELLVNATALRQHGSRLI